MKSISIALFVALSLFSFGCKNKKKQASTAAKAKHFKGDSCEACGMIIREQSSPRGQAIHRDGKRVYFCSISDMLSYLQTPSPHGRVKSIFVETLSSKEDPKKFSTARRPWSSAKKVYYVLEVPKPRVMGVPILIYRTAKEAHTIAKKWNGKIYRWNQLVPAWKKLRAKPKH